MEIWKQVAIDDLKRFKYLENSIIYMEGQIEDLSEGIIASSSNLNRAAVQNGSFSIDDKYNNAIVLKDKLAEQVKRNKADYTRIKSALEKLSEKERKILQYAYIDRKHGYMDRIMGEYNIESAQAYRYVNYALCKYILISYGG